MICAKCKVNEALNKKNCAECREKARGYVIRMRERRRGQGMCILCGSKQPLEGASYCSDCAINCIERVQELRAKREGKGVCIFCGKRKVADGNKSCKTCAEKINTKYHQENKSDVK